MRRKKGQTKVVLIAGASSTLGGQIAEEFANRDFDVFGVSRSIPTGKRSYKFLKADVTKNSDCKRVINSVLKEVGRIDVLVNAAGVTLTGPAESFTPEDYLRILDVNSVGAFRMIKEVVPTMRKAGGGRVINITSLNGLVSLPNFALYSSSKHALEALGLAISYELAGDKIFVTNVAPGAIDFENLQVPKRLLHKPAREKFRLLYILFPMIKARAIARKIVDLAETEKPPQRVLLGRDVVVTNLLSRFLPWFMWSRLMSYIWGKQ